MVSYAIRFEKIRKRIKSKTQFLLGISVINALIVYKIATN